MRISPATVSILTELAKKHFGEEAEVRLFGSRTNDSLKGGDIELHIVAPNSVFKNEIFFLVDVERLLDEVVELQVQRGEPNAFDALALSEGILLNKS